MIAYSEQLDLKLKFKSEDVVGRHIYKYDVHELTTTNAVLNEVKIKPGDIMLDIGANIGWYALLFAKLGAQVHAFEPDPLNYELLTANIKLNQFGNVITAHQVAVSDKKSVMPLYQYSNSNRGRHSLIPEDGCAKVDVDVVRLDDFLASESVDVDKIKFIKIDIEGYEYHALKGGENLLHRVPFLLLEHVPKHIRKGGYQPKDIVDLLHSYNYVPHIITNNGIQEISTESLSNEEGEYDVFFCKSDAAPTH